MKERIKETLITGCALCVIAGPAISIIVATIIFFHFVSKFW